MTCNVVAVDQHHRIGQVVQVRLVRAEQGGAQGSPHVVGQAVAPGISLGSDHTA